MGSANLLVTRVWLKQGQRVLLHKILLIDNVYVKRLVLFFHVYVKTFLLHYSDWRSVCDCQQPMLTN